MFCVNVTILLIGCHCFVMVDISRVLFLLEYVLQGSLEILINVAFRHNCDWVRVSGDNHMSRWISEMVIHSIISLE